MRPPSLVVVGAELRRDSLHGLPSRSGRSPRRLVLGAALVLTLASTASAQHPAFRIKGRVTTGGGEPIAGARVRLEAFFGYAAGTFAGQRLFDTTTNGRGEWNVGALQPGIWLFDVTATGYLPETVALPIRILTTVSMGTSNMTLVWDLVLKPLKTPDDAWGEYLTDVTALAQYEGRLLGSEQGIDGFGCLGHCFGLR